MSDKVEAKLSAKDEGLTAALERIETALASLNKTCQKLGEIMIKARDAGATKVIGTVQTEVDKLAKAEASPEINADDRASPEIKKAADEVQNLDKAKAEPTLEAKDDVTPKAEQAGDSINSVPEESMTALEAANHVTPAAEQASDSVHSIPESDSVVLNAEDNVSDAVDGVIGKLDELEDKADSTGKSLGDSLSFGLGASIGGKVVDGLTTGLKGLTTGAVEAGKSFDASMSKVAALQGDKLGATGFNDLAEAAKNAGATTQFSATEAADALQYMALAGWDAQKSVDTLPAILNLAAAADMDLAKASDTVTDYLSAFSNSLDGAGKEALSAAEMVDIMAFAQANSNTSADQLGDAWRNCAANLNAAGQDVQTTTSFLEAMANQGLKGSEAGTAMAAMMRDITAKMDKGCISIGKTSVAVQDAEGNFRDLTDIMKDVEAATDGMGDAEKAAALSKTFTADSQRGVNLLLNEGMSKVEGYENALRSCGGAAEKAAATMNDNLAGDLKTLGSAWEAVQISISEKVEPALRLVTQTATKVLTAVNNLIKGWKTWNDGMRDFQGEEVQEAFAALSAPMKDFYAIIKNLQTAWQNFTRGFAESGAMEAIQESITAVRDALLSMSISMSGKAANGANSFGQAVGELVKIIAKAVTVVTDFVRKLNLGNFGPAIAGIAGVVGAFKMFDKLKSLNPLSGFLKNFKKGTSEAAKNAASSKSKIAQIFESLGTVLTSAGTAVSTVFQGIGKAIGSLNIQGALSFVVVIASLTAAFLALAACQSVVLPFLQGLSDILVSLVNGVLQAFAQCLVTLSPVMLTIAQALSALAPLVVAFGEAMAAAAPFVVALGIAIGSVIQAIGVAAAGILTAMVPIVQIIGDVFTNVVGIVSDAVVRIVEALAPYIPEVTRLAEVTSDIIDRICTCFERMLSQVSPILDSLTNLVGQLGDTFTEVFNGIQSVVETVFGGITGILDSIAGIIDSIGNAALNAGRGFEAMANGIRIITELNAWDMAGSLAAVAAGMAGIAASAGGLSSAASAMTSLMGSTREASKSASSACASMTGMAAVIPVVASVAGSAASAFASAFSSIEKTASSGMNNVASAVKSSGTKMASSAKSAATQTNSTFKTGLTRLGPTATSAMNSMVSALSSGSQRAVSVARSMASAIVSALSSAQSGAYSAGSYIGQGLANGMASTLGRVRSVATELAAQAQRAIEAKAVISSPSKVTTQDGIYIGQGLANGIESMKRRVWNAAEELVSYGSLASPLTAAFTGGSLSADESYGLRIELNPVLSLDINGKEFARATADDMTAEMDRRAVFKKRAGGSR